MLFQLFCVSWVLSLALQAAEPKKSAQVFEFEGQAQGTSYHIRYSGAEQVDIKSKVDQQLANFDKIFSNYRPDSDISRFNQETSGDWFPVDADLVRLVELSNRISKQSAGAFDITVGALIKVWGFGPFKRETKVLPSDATIAEAKKLVDYRRLLSRRKPPALKKTLRGLNIDLSGVAQGYSVDKIAAFLDELGLRNYLVEIGGEIKTRGQKQTGIDWELLVESPSLEPGEIGTLVHARGLGLTTSGDYREYFEKDGKRYSHTIDPRSGRPIEHKLASVTVIAQTAAEADAWDTALMVLGPEESRKIVQGKALSAFLVLHDGSGFLSEEIGEFKKHRIKK